MKSIGKGFSALVLLAVVLFLVVRGCATAPDTSTVHHNPPEASGASSSSDTQGHGTLTQMPYQTPAESEKPVNYLTLGIPKNVDGLYEITLKDVYFTPVLTPSHPAGVYHEYKPMLEDMFLVGILEVRSLSSSEGDSAFSGSMRVVYRGKETIEARPFIERNDGASLDISGDISIEPLSSSVIGYAAAVATAVKEDGHSISLIFTVNNNDYTYVMYEEPMRYISIGTPVIVADRYEVTLQDVFFSSIKWVEHKNSWYDTFVDSDKPACVVAAVTVRNMRDTWQYMKYTLTIEVSYNGYTYLATPVREKSGSEGYFERLTELYTIDGFSVNDFCYYTRIEDLEKKGNPVSMILTINGSDYTVVSEIVT